MSDRPILHVHLVSDATGETVNSVAKAALVQFSEVDYKTHLWSLVRSAAHMERVLAGIEAQPGPVLYSLLDEAVIPHLRKKCRKLHVPAIAVLDPVIAGLAHYLGMKSGHEPGKQHALDAAYFNRIEAMNFTLAHDDGQSPWSVGEADIILVGVSRSSKSPTAMYLANRGLKVANVPFVPGVELPPALFAKATAEHPHLPMIIGLSNDPNRLVQLRRNRLRLLHENEETDYTSMESVRREVNAAQRLFTEQGWPVIDVTRRSIEESAAEILRLWEDRHHVVAAS
ncbi:MAG: pyruvate, water dikinase regulatory protein [Candidatus Symbiobacter sp.]|nr:pyruvate, water dikinase regulatory protein [Candidatus Symbiobacter sp.]